MEDKKIFKREDGTILIEKMNSAFVPIKVTIVLEDKHQLETFASAIEKWDNAIHRFLTREIKQ